MVGMLDGAAELNSLANVPSPLAPQDVPRNCENERSQLFRSATHFRQRFH